MKRRSFLLGSAAFLGGVARAAAGMDMHGGNMHGMPLSEPVSETTKRISKLPVGAPLSELVTLANNSKSAHDFAATIEAAITAHEFTPGLATQVLAYNASLPGAMIKVFEGDSVRIVFKNRIPDQVSTIHWHGLEIPAAQDGNPMAAVASGADHTYEFTIPEGSAGSYWYHPHPHKLTSEQVYRGLAAPFVVCSKSDPLPTELGDTVLFISSISLNTDGTIAQNTDADLMNGREGDHVLVNGTKQPVLNLAPGSSRRFRIYNATNGRYLRLKVDGHSMTLVGTDCGLIAEPIAGLKEILLAPAERVEVVIDFQSEPGAFTLSSKPYERGWMGADKPEAQTISLLTFNLSGPVAKPIKLPQKLRSLAPLGAPRARHRIELSEKMVMTKDAMVMDFLINGQTFDAGRVDIKARVGEVELWHIFNNSDMDHPFHLHGTQFQIVTRERNGRILPEPYLAWKDTVNIAARETVSIKFRQSMPGLRMYHCHILEHEDNGMMGILDVA